MFVETGLASDTMTEITSGLTVGDHVVTSTITANGKTATQSNGLLGLLSGKRATPTGAGARTSSGASSNATFSRPTGP